MTHGSSEAWSVIANVASATGITTVAYSGVVAGYRAYNSASNSIAEAEKKLLRVDKRLKGLSVERRKEIEKATQSKTQSASQSGELGGESPGCTSLQGLEAQLRRCVLLSDARGRLSFEFKLTMGISRLMDMHCRLIKRHEEASFPERHNPYSEFRKYVSTFEDEAKELLHDTLASFLLRLILQSNPHYTCGSDNNGTTHK